MRVGADDFEVVSWSAACIDCIGKHSIKIVVSNCFSTNELRTNAFVSWIELSTNKCMINTNDLNISAWEWILMTSLLLHVWCCFTPIADRLFVRHLILIVANECNQLEMGYHSTADGDANHYCVSTETNDCALGLFVFRQGRISSEIKLKSVHVCCALHA